MPHSLERYANAAVETNRSLDRALTASRSQWADPTRLTFDQQHCEVIVTSGRKVADDLESLARQLAAVMALLE